MNPLLISGFGTSITVDKRKLVINNKSNDEHYEFYPHQISYDSIIFDGHTGNISFEAMRWLTKHDIPITLLNWNGNLLATLNPKENNQGKLRVKQYEKYMLSNIRYDIANIIVQEKIHKSHMLLHGLSHYYALDLHDVDDMFARELHAFNMYNKPSEHDINKIMVYEAKVAKAYWDYFTLIFNEISPEFNFTGRRNKSNSWNMNASDEINAMLNYGYAILEAQVRRSINAVGLDPAVGYLHELKSGNTPLVYDMQELYRWLIDLSVIELLEDKKLKKSDFITTENYHIRLKEHTATMLIDKIKVNFNMKAKYKTQNHTYENILQDNVQTLANFIVERTDDLRIIVPDFKIKRNDDNNIRELLLNMSPEERKQIGLSKTTLWYMKKNLREGKKIKVYNKVKEKIKAD